MLEGRDGSRDGVRDTHHSESLEGTEFRPSTLDEPCDPTPVFPAVPRNSVRSQGEGETERTGGGSLLYRLDCGEEEGPKTPLPPSLSTLSGFGLVSGFSSCHEQ